MEDKIREVPGGSWERLVDGVWVPITKEEFEALAKDGVKEVEFEPEDKELDIDIKFENGRELEKVVFKGNDAIDFKFKDEDIEHQKHKAASLIYSWIESAVGMNQLSFIEDLYNKYFKKDEPIEEDVREEEEIDISVDNEGSSEEQPEEGSEDSPVVFEMDTVKDVYNYVSNKDNPLDSNFVAAIVDNEGDIESLGGQNFRVSEVYKPFKPDGNSYCRILVGILDGSDDGVFVTIPESWQTVEALDNVDYETINNDLAINAIVSEALVIEDPDNFYKELGDLYAKGPAYLDKADVSLPEERPSEEEPESPVEEPTEAEVTEIENPEIEEFNFESVSIRYKPSLKESWLKEFKATDKFTSLVSTMYEKLQKYLRPSLFKAVTFILSEDKNFVSIRVNKSLLLDSSLTTEWFKKRLNKICESIKLYSKGLRIVETRGSYYTRSFFLVEAITSNYCLSEDLQIPEISFINGKTLYEAEEKQFNPKFLEYIESVKGQDSTFVIRPSLRDKEGNLIESYKVDNDSKIPYFIRLNECEPQIIFIPQGIEPFLVQEEPKPEVVVEEPIQATDIAQVVAPVDPKEEEPKPFKLADLYSFNSDSFQKLFDSECMMREADSSLGFSVDCVPVDTEEAKVLACNVYGQHILLIPNSCVDKGDSLIEDPYLVCNPDGSLTTCGQGCDKFLKVLAFKYLS